MAHGIPNTDYDFVHPDDRDLAERFVMVCWPELQRSFYGAREHFHSMEARYKAAGIRKANANERTADARRALEQKEMRYRMAGKVPTDDDLRAEKNEVERAIESEAAADTEIIVAGNAMQDARIAANKQTKELAQLAVKDQRIRRRAVKLGRGAPEEMLKANLVLQNEKRAEAERVRNAGTPVSTLKAEALSKLDALIGDPFRLSYADGGVEFRWPVLAIPAEHKLPGRVVTAPDPMPMFLALFGDEVKKRVLARIDADHRGDDSLRITKEEKRIRLAKLRAEILELQYAEGALRVLLAGDAPEIAFRPQMDPMTTLGAEVF